MTRTLATYLIDTHEPLLVELARGAIETDEEQAVTLSSPSASEPLTASEIATGSEMMVTSPEPENGTAAIVRLHTHPEEAQVTFSTKDISTFVNSTLAAIPYGRVPDAPVGYGVVGWRGDDVEDGTAHLQTLEPSQQWADIGVLDRDRVQREVVRLAESARTLREDNPLFDLLDPYIIRDSVEFATAKRPQPNY